MGRKGAYILLISLRNRPSQTKSAIFYLLFILYYQRISFLDYSISSFSAARNNQGDDCLLMRTCKCTCTHQTFNKEDPCVYRKHNIEDGRPGFFEFVPLFKTYKKYMFFLCLFIVYLVNILNMLNIIRLNRFDL